MMKRAASAEMMTIFDTDRQSRAAPARPKAVEADANAAFPNMMNAKTAAACLGLPSLQVDLYRGRAAFDALEVEWNALFARAGAGRQVFQQFNWLWHCDQIYGDGPKAPEIIIVTARRAGQLVLVWPLQLTCARGLCQLTWLGHPVGQYGDVLIDDLPDSVAEQALRLTWETLCNAVHPDLVILRRVRDDTPVSAFLDSVGAHVIERNEAPAMSTATAGSFAHFCDTHQTRHMRKERRRLMRRFEESGAVRFERVIEPERKAEVARAAVLLKRDWLRSKHRASKTLADDRVLAFFERVARDDARPVGCEVHAVWCGDDLASAQIAFQCGDRLAVHVIVYNVAYAKAGAGGLQLAHLMQTAFDRDLAHIDLLAPRSDYKMEWANEVVGVADHVYAPTARGRLFMNTYLKRVRPVLKSLAPHLPARVRTWASI
ncbi:MAG: GNAT family N-acetyltransferase [Pseudomonadota bacterium]